MSCPVGQYSIEQVTNQLHSLDALEQDFITSPSKINGILEHLMNSNPGLAVWTDPDKLILFIGTHWGYLVDSFNGCSRVIYTLDVNSTTNLLHYLMGASL